MKMIKRFGIGFFLAIIFILTMSTVTDAASLYVKSADIPHEVTSLAAQYWEEYLNNMIFNENDSSLNYYLGQPFTITYSQSTKYNYPVISKENQRITYMLEIDSSDAYNPDSFILSKALATKLEEISETISTDENNPINLDGINQNIFYEFQGERYPVLIVNNTDFPDIQNREMANTISNISEENVAPNLRINRSIPEFDNNVLPWEVYEIQTDKPWCQWYTYAAVINNQSNKPITSAKKMLDGKYPNATDAQKADWNWLKNQGSLIDSLNYLNRTYNKSAKFESNSLPFEIVKSEIDKKRPIITNLKDDTTDGHAIVLMGYTAQKGTSNTSYKPFYHYWNPWWEDTFVVSSNSPNMILGPYKYRWNHTIYNFKEGKYQDKVDGIVTLKSTATGYQTGEGIPTTVRNKEYTIQDVKEVSQSRSKLAYYLSGLNKWVLEQDVQQYSTLFLNKTPLLLSKASHTQTGETISTAQRNKRYSAIQVKPVRQSNSKLAYYLNGLNMWILEQDLAQ